MKNTALTHIHEGLGAKMLPFAGYNMPILYEGVNAEHETVRNAVWCFFDTWEFFISGPNALL
jgi:aminomethyltransferase